MLLQFENRSQRKKQQHPANFSWDMFIQVTRNGNIMSEPSFHWCKKSGTNFVVDSLWMSPKWNTRFLEETGTQKNLCMIFKVNERTQYKKNLDIRR